MAAKAQIIISLSQHLRINRAVRLVANSAALTHRLMLKEHRLRLLTMTSRTGLIPATHGESAPGLHDVAPVRIMALNAVHVTFRQRMMLGQFEVRVDVLVAAETSLRIFSRVMNESVATAADLDVLAAGPMAGFATGSAGGPVPIQMHSGVHIVGKHFGDGPVAIDARLVADKRCPFNNWWRSHDGTRHGGTGAEHRGKAEQSGEHAQSKQMAPKTRPCGRHFG